MKKIRNTNIEILRIISILGVIVLHYNNANMGKAFIYAKNIPSNMNILIFAECLCICAVNLFVLLSGYFMCRNANRSLKKPVRLIFEVIFFSVIFYVLKVGLGIEIFDRTNFFYKFIPANYFVVLYITLYFISPYINIMLNNVCEKNLKHLIIIIMILFSIYPSLVELFNEITSTSILGLSSIGMYGSQYGYTIVNFILIYILGAYLKITEYQSYNKRKCFALFILSAFIIFLWYHFGDFIGKDTTGSALSYCNPFCIAEAALLFMIFNQLKIKNSKIVNYFAKGSFVVFLVHTHFISLLYVEKFVTKSAGGLILHLIISVLFVYCMSILVYILYSFLEKGIDILIIRIRRRIV